MALLKILSDHINRALFDTKGSLPQELRELRDYFHHHGPINFSFKNEGGVIIAVSTDFRYGSIVTTGKDQEELDKNIKDAILTSFDIPSSYAKETAISRVSKEATEQKSYALA